MTREFDATRDAPPAAWGTYEDAERLRRWAFLRRTPMQRLAWLQSALEIAYRSSALALPGPMTQQEWGSMRSTEPQPAGRSAK
jgi:hypothetical protein